jgi:hypothetical protein
VLKQVIPIVVGSVIGLGSYLGAYWWVLLAGAGGWVMVAVVVIVLMSPRPGRVAPERDAGDEIARVVHKPGNDFARIGKKSAGLSDWSRFRLSTKADRRKVYIAPSP